MTQFTKTGELIHYWESSKKDYKAGQNFYHTTLRDKDHDRFLVAFGNINRAALLRELLIKAIEDKEAENDRIRNEGE